MKIARIDHFVLTVASIDATKQDGKWLMTGFLAGD